MKPTKNTLKEEILNRVSLLEKVMPTLKNDKEVYLLIANEHSINEEFLKCIEFFENKENVKLFTESYYTPIKCSKTKMLLKIGDKVEKEEHGTKICGTLIFDEYFNEYLIRTETGGNIRFRDISKIEKFYDYHIDTTSVECRNRPLKKLW